MVSLVLSSLEWPATAIRYFTIFVLWRWIKLACQIVTKILCKYRVIYLLHRNITKPYSRIENKMIPYHYHLTEHINMWGETIQHLLLQRQKKTWKLCCHYPARTCYGFNFTYIFQKALFHNQF